MGYLKHLVPCALDCDCKPDPCTSCAPPVEISSVECRTRSASKTKCGFEEFGTPSSPPKIYKAKTGSGTGNFDDTSQVYYNTYSGTSQPCISSDTLELEWGNSVDGVLGTSTGTSPDSLSGCGSGSGNEFEGNILTGAPLSCTSPEVTPTITTTSMTWNWADAGGGWSGSVSAVLSDEYTTSALEVDAAAALDVAAWSSWAAIPCTGAMRDLSSDEVTISVREAQYKVTFSAAVPAGSFLNWDVYIDGVFYALDGSPLFAGGETQYTASQPAPAANSTITLTNFVLNLP